MEMNTDTNNINHYIFSDFPPLTLSSLSPASSTHANPRKKRTKFLRIAATANPKPKPKPIKKPDPSAPKITPPCTECGKSFWSQKALFGHMRCHPERQWRGINPPPTFRRSDEDFTEEDHEVAACLLMIANGPTASAAASDTTACTVSQPTPDFSYSDRYPDQNVADASVGTPTAAAAPNCGRFECTSCKKVFGSHQALGGHRASHKNVKGCYAITKNDGEEEEEEEVGCCSGEMMMMILKDNCNNNNIINGHKCSICFRVFSSGQALGGHMRCHWEKVEEPPPPPSSRVCVFDLNLAPPLQEDGDASSLPYPSSGLALDLRLGF